ncbi:MAG: hypothetical protein Q8K00_11700 [Syntrophales bacterium]|nr:hypothetical protein [Syntrophales bacterium]
MCVKRIVYTNLNQRSRIGSITFPMILLIDPHTPEKVGLVPDEHRAASWRTGS